MKQLDIAVSPPSFLWDPYLTLLWLFFNEHFLWWPLIIVTDRQTKSDAHHALAQVDSNIPLRTEQNISIKFKCIKTMRLPCQTQRFYSCILYKTNKKWWLFNGEEPSSTLFSKRKIFEKKHFWRCLSFGEECMPSVCQWNWSYTPFWQCSWWQLAKNPISKLIMVLSQLWNVWVHLIRVISQNWIPWGTGEVPFVLGKSVFHSLPRETQCHKKIPNLYALQCNLSYFANILWWLVIKQFNIERESSGILECGLFQVTPKTI